MACMIVPALNVACLMAAGWELIVLKPAATDQTMLTTPAARTEESIGQAGFLQGPLIPSQCHPG